MWRMKVDRPKEEQISSRCFWMRRTSCSSLFEAGQGHQAGAAGAGGRLLRTCAVARCWDLKWDAIDFERGTHYHQTDGDLRQCGRQIRRVIEQESAKTKSSMRTLPLVGSFREYFMQVKEAQELNKQVCGNCYNYEYDGFVFVDELGERMQARIPDQRNFRNFWRGTACDGCASTICRHSCAISACWPTAYPSSTFRSGWGTATFPPRRTSTPILDYKFETLLGAGDGDRACLCPEGGDFSSRWEYNAVKSRGRTKLILSKTMERTAQNRVGFALERKNKKACKPAWLLAFCGGELGIRTLETFRSTAFRVLHLRPLGQLSVYVQSAFSFQKLFVKNALERRRKEQQIIQFFEPGKTCMVTRFLVDETDSFPARFRVSPVMTASIRFYIRLKHGKTRFAHTILSVLREKVKRFLAKRLTYTGQSGYNNCVL